MTAREFEGKIVFVTGATSGIGRGVAVASIPTPPCHLTSS